jgi:hypothetical protein
MILLKIRLAYPNDANLSDKVSEKMSETARHVGLWTLVEIWCVATE